MDARLALTLTLAGLALGPGRAHALGCDGHLVEIGDTEAYVRSVCGEPTEVHSRVETRTAVLPAYGTYLPPYRTAGYGYVATTTVQIDVLFYDFGPTRFVDELTFENGILRADRIVGYGTAAAARARRQAQRERAVRRRPDE